MKFSFNWPPPAVVDGATGLAAAGGAAGTTKRRKLLWLDRTPLVAHHVEARRWNHRDDTGDEVERIEDDRLRAILPGLFELIAYVAVVQTCQSLLGNGWASQIATELLESGSVVRVDAKLGVDVDARAHGVGLCRASQAGIDQSQRRLSSALGEQVQPLGGGWVAAL